MTLSALRRRRRRAAGAAAPRITAASVLRSAAGDALRDPLEDFAAERVLQLLPAAVVLVDERDQVRLANDAALEMQLIAGASVDVPELRSLIRTARRENVTRCLELTLERGGLPRRVQWAGARAEPLDNGSVALIVDDLTEARRVEAVRRDFVANVGHEIKTPVGALTILAEAALDARDDPATLLHFVERMNREALRLSRLVQELLDLSKLQGGDPLPGRTEVAVDAVIDEALDRTRSGAELKGIELVRGGDLGLVVTGSEAQLVTALANLLDNAISYSSSGTRVAVGVHSRDRTVEIAVSDQGIGIDPDEQQRIFERFYRIDPARSRATGGTGLGLAIVKHVVSNHGGEVTVWSSPGAGSTFTIRLPAVGEQPTEDASTDAAPTDVPSGRDDGARSGRSQQPREVRT
jgi:two-component system sensor histidine kinase SenX3